MHIIHNMSASSLKQLSVVVATYSAIEIAWRKSLHFFMIVYVSYQRKDKCVLRGNSQKVKRVWRVLENQETITKYFHELIQIAFLLQHHKNKHVVHAQSVKLGAEHSMIFMEYQVVGVSPLVSHSNF